MPEELLHTKLTIAPLRPNIVPRPRLIERLDQGLRLGHKLVLISAPAGFGKTTLVSEWVAGWGRAKPEVPVAWLSLEEEDGDLQRFLTYLVAALQTIAGGGAAAGDRMPVGERVMGMLQSPQPAPAESLLTVLLNDVSAIADDFLLVLDDYHVLESSVVDQALAFLLEHLPPQMHLVITTREDPNLPLARLRARGQLTEMRVADLRFTLQEATEFLNEAMELALATEDVAALERRTEGWIAGLQLAAISMRGQEDTSAFVTSFTGSHRFVLDYLVEEVLQRQPESVQRFLLRTSILDGLCGPLCDAVTRDPAVPGQETLLALEQANLFLVPLDDQRRWYRYHHLFADLLRQRLQQGMGLACGEDGVDVADLHKRASAWYEANGLEIEAFRHAVEANDVDRAARLIEGEGMPLHYRGAMVPVMNWLASLPAETLNANPSLWVTYSSALTMAGKPVDSIEEKLLAAEAALGSSGALQPARLDDRILDLIGQIAATRAMLAVPQNKVQTVIVQSRRALDYLHPDNAPVRTAALWALGHAHQLQGDGNAATEAFSNILSASQASGNVIFEIAANTGLGQIKEAENQLHLASKFYQRVLQIAGDPPLPVACGAYLGLTRIFYEWNDLDTAHDHGRQCMKLAQLLENLDTPAECGVWLARIALAQGDVAGAVARLAEAEQFIRQHNFTHRKPDVAAAQVLVMLRQGNPAAAAGLAQQYDLPLSQTRVHLAQGDPAAALTLLAPVIGQAQAKGRVDERLKALALQALAHQAQGDVHEALQVLEEALVLAEPGSFMRTFVDEGAPMAQLLSEAAARGIRPDYVRALLDAFEGIETPMLPAAQPLVEPLSARELEILQLLAQGLSNRQIGERLFVAVNTVKGHNRRIFGKLQVQRRTEAVARARQLGLL